MGRIVGLLLLAPVAGFAMEAILGTGRFDLQPRVWGVTLEVAGGAALLSLLAGIPVGFVLAHRRAALPLALTLIPLLIPPALAAASWMGAGRPPQGALGCAAVLASVGWPVVALLLYASLTRLPGPALESAALHLSAARTLRRVVWPHVRPAIGAGAILVFLFAASEFTVPATCAVPTLSYVIYDRLSAFQYGAAAAAALPLVAMAVALAAVLHRIPMLPAVGPPRPFLRGLPLLSCWTLSIAAWLLTAILPAVVCIARVGSVSAVAKVVTANGESFLWSAWIAGATALGLVAWSALTPRRSRMEPLWLIGLVLPAIVGAFGLLALAQRTGAAPYLMSGGFMIILALMGRFAYVAWIPLREPVERAQLEAAELAGLSKWRMWRKIVWPELRPRATAAAAIVFVLATAEIGPAVLLNPPGSQTLVQHLFNWMHFGYDQTVAAFSLVLFLLAAIIAGIGSYVGRERRTEVAG